jgi:hypothetical protein
MNIQGVNLSGVNVKDATFVTGNNQLLYLDAGNVTSYSGSGSTWYDLSGNSNNTTAVSTPFPTYSPSNSGYFTFNGTSTYFQTAASKYNVSYTGKTVFVAANLTSALTSGQYRCLFGAGGGTQTRNFNTYLYNTGSAYQIHFSSNSFGGYSGNLPYTPGNWFTLAVTQNTSGLISWYFNGALISTLSSTFSQYVTDTYEQVGASDNYWNGPLSVVAVYGSQLTAAQIGQCHNNVCARYSLPAVQI